MSTIFTRAFALLVLVALVSAPVAAQRPAASPFADIRGLKCTFMSVASAEFVNGAPRVTTIPNGFSFEVTDVDVRRGRARIVGSNGGTAEVTLILTGTSLNLFEQTRIGNMNVTSIFAAGGPPGRYLTVFSQHLGDMAGAPSASQAYGACESAAP